MEGKKQIPVQEIIECCERTAYERKAENILRLDLTKVEAAQSSYYLICTGLSTPHIGAIAERIQREIREKFQVRPVSVDGEPQSQWIIVDYGFLMVHVMTNEAREKYQLEGLWNDAGCLDVVAKLDAEHKARTAGQQA